MWFLLALGIIFNLAAVAANYLIFFGLRTGRAQYFLCAAAFVLAMMVASALVAFQVFQGLTQKEWTAYGLSFLTLLLGAPLILLYSKDLDASD